MSGGRCVVVVVLSISLSLLSSNFYFTHPPLPSQVFRCPIQRFALLLLALGNLEGVFVCWLSGVPGSFQ